MLTDGKRPLSDQDVQANRASTYGLPAHRGVQTHCAQPHCRLTSCSRVVLLRVTCGHQLCVKYAQLMADISPK